MINEWAELETNLMKSNDVSTVEVVLAWQVMHPVPIELRTGEIVRIGRHNEQWTEWVWCTGSSGKGCWVPESYLMAHDDGLTGWLTQDYSSAELEVQPGESVTLICEESGWWWSCNQAGQTGWVPATHLNL